MSELKPLPILGIAPGFVMQSQNFGPWKYVLISVFSVSTDGHGTKTGAIKEWNRRVRVINKKLKNTGSEIKDLWNSMEEKSC